MFFHLPNEIYHLPIDLPRKQFGSFGISRTVLCMFFFHCPGQRLPEFTSRQVILQMLKDNRVLGGGILAQKPWPALPIIFLTASKVGVHTAETWIPRIRRNSTKGKWRSLILSSRDWTILGRKSFWNFLSDSFLTSSQLLHHIYFCTQILM